MKLICKTCEKMPLIKLFYVDEGRVIVRINCKCGKKFHDVSTFVSEYTDIEIHQKKENPDEILDNKLINQKKICKEKNLYYFCETCFENIYDNLDINIIHEKHNLIKIDSTNTIDENELEQINKNLIMAENKIMKYLPEMRDMLLNDCKKEKEKEEIKHYSEFSMEKNILILSLLKLVYNLYISENEISYQLIYNLKSNCDYNLNKYNLDLKTIEKDKFIVFLKFCLIICCNYSLNKVYNNLVKDKKALEEMIFHLPIKETGHNEQIVFSNEMMKSNNSIYFGEKNKLNNLAEGRGFLYFSSGTYYFGYFKNDVFLDGFGKTINQKGSTYIGQFKNGLANGVGKLASFNGNIYQGFWTNNKLDGFGIVSIKNGKNFIGEISEGFFTGYGIMKYKNGNLYKGKLKEGKLDDIGMLEYANKKKYVGEFREGYKSGYGIMTWPNGEKFEGNWNKDTFKFGFYYWPSGNVYVGNFSNDGVNGYGSFYSSLLGTIESGIWKDGKRENIYNSENIPSTRYLSFL
jgi:hypothetical protein